MADGHNLAGAKMRPAKFQHPDITASGANRASVSFDGLETLWVNTGTLCNIECAHCYIESSPKNDRLVYLKSAELVPFLQEAKNTGAQKIGFTGGEPFLNPDMLVMLRATLEAGFETLVLTNAMAPMMRPRIKAGLLTLNKEFSDQFQLRISLDHYAPDCHDNERGEGSFASTLAGVLWLNENDINISLAGRTLSGEDENSIRAGFKALLAANDIALNAADDEQLIIFPEMDAGADATEITTKCWDVLGKDPASMMCAHERMLIKRLGAASPVLVACTLLAYDLQFEMGETIAEASRPVKLNHPHCAQFCVLGGASCTGTA